MGIPRPGRKCSETESPTLECVRIANNAFTATITNAERAYWIESTNPTIEHEIPLVDGDAVYTLTIYSGAIFTVCAEGIRGCGICGGDPICCSFECAAEPPTGPECDCCEEILDEYGDPTICSNILDPNGNVWFACLGFRPSETFPPIPVGYVQDCDLETPWENSGDVPDCKCWSTELGIAVDIQYIQFEVTGTGTGTFNPYIPPDDEFPACDEAACPDFNGTYIVPCEGKDGPYGGLDLLCTTDIGGTNYDWYVYKWWKMEDGVLYLRMGIISRLSGSGDPAPIPTDIFTEDDWIGDDVDFQQRLDEYEYSWDRSPLTITDTCTWAIFTYNSCSDLDVFPSVLIDSGLCNDPTVTISELIYT